MKKFNLNNEIIDIIGNEATDWKGIVLALAKKDPKILYAIVKGDEEEEFKFHIYNLYAVSRNKNKVPLVKMVREKYGLGLKEALDYVNQIIIDNEGEDETETK